MMKRILVAATLIAISGCSLIRQHHHQANPYERPIFYAKYLDPANPFDRRIQQDLDALRANPGSAVLHNDLGQLLAQKGFPKDAEVEFERAADSDSHFYPAWYNLGLLRSARGDYRGGRFAFGRTIKYKPGHPAALFQMGLMEEQRGHSQAAVDYYAKAFLINHAMIDVKVNPRIRDSKLTHLALLKAYPKEHLREALKFQPAPPRYVSNTSSSRKADSSQAPADAIVSPAAPVTDPSRQTTQPNPVPPPGM